MSHSSAHQLEIDQNKLNKLRNQYINENYEKIESKEITSIIKSFGSNYHLLPLLPPSHFWDLEQKCIMRHKDVPSKTKIYVFGEESKDKLSYIICESDTIHHPDHSFRTIYSFTTPKLNEVYNGERSQKTFQKGTLEKFVAGHCIDHADTSDEKLNYYNINSTHHFANLIPEPYDGWGIKIRSHLVKELRNYKIPYSQFVYYPSQIEYTDYPSITAIPKGVLFFSHNNNVLDGWQVDWDDKEIHYNSTGRGPRIRLKNNVIENLKCKHLAYINGRLDDKFTVNLDEKINSLQNNSKILDPYTRYKVQVLADQELIPKYILHIIKSDLKENRVHYVVYWLKRFIDQLKILIEEKILIPELILYFIIEIGEIIVEIKDKKNYSHQVEILKNYLKSGFKFNSENKEELINKKENITNLNSNSSPDSNITSPDRNNNLFNLNNSSPNNSSPYSNSIFNTTSPDRNKIYNNSPTQSQFSPNRNYGTLNSSTSTPERNRILFNNSPTQSQESSNSNYNGSNLNNTSESSSILNSPTQLSNSPIRNNNSTIQMTNGESFLLKFYQGKQLTNNKLDTLSPGVPVIIEFVPNDNPIYPQTKGAMTKKLRSFIHENMNSDRLNNIPYIEIKGELNLFNTDNMLNELKIFFNKTTHKYENGTYILQ